eukprot:8461806-Pyramimonas_sp.AAC.1
MGREYSPVWSAIKGALTVNICCDHLVLVLGGGLERPLRLLVARVAVQPLPAREHQRLPTLRHRHALAEPYHRGQV